MSSPYKSKTMRLEVNGVTVDTVELVTLEVLHTGGVESKYGQDYDYQFKPRNRHAIGMKRCRFTIRKWYKADSSNTDLFYTLFDNDTEFTLKEYLTGVTGFAGLEISECEIYTYTPTTGSANDIIQEEIIGEGTVIVCDKVINRDYPTCSWWATGSWLPATYSTENLMSQSWKDDDTWNYYMALIDMWTTQHENGNALYDFGSAKNATYYVKWKGILTPHTTTASGKVECKIYAGLTSVVPSMTLVKQYTLTSPIGGPSVTFDEETVSFSGNYRYIFIYFTTFGDFGGQTFIVVLPTKLWVNGVWRE